MLLESNNRVERYFLNWWSGSSFASMKGSSLCVFETVAGINVGISGHQGDTIAEFSNAACHLSSLCWHASFIKDVWVFEDISRARHLLSDGQLNRARSAFFTTWGGWGQHRTQGNKNVRRQHYCSRLKAWTRQNLTIRPLFLTVKNHNHVRLFILICISFDFRDAKPKFPVSRSNP